MELIWLETFITLADSGSLRNAAEKLNVSPATVSERIASLEDALGTQLMTRSSSGSELTQAGRLYIQNAQKILSDWDNLVDLIRPLDDDQFQKLSIGLPDRVMFPALGRFLDSFMAEHPQIELNLYSDQEIRILDSLRNATTDIFFAFEPGDNIRQSMITTPVHRTKMGILIPQNHRLSLKNSVSFSDLDGETFILYPEYNDSSMHAFQEKVLKLSGIRYLIYGGHFSPSLYALPVKMGCGIALFPKVMKSGFPPRTAFLELTDDIAMCYIYMIYSPANRNPSLKLFLDCFGNSEGVDES